MAEQYKIYQIRQYEVLWDMNDAVVSGESPEDACSVLEEYLKNPEGQYPMGADIKFRGRGEIIDTHIFADKREVIYTMCKKTFEE